VSRETEKLKEALDEDENGMTLTSTAWTKTSLKKFRSSESTIEVTKVFEKVKNSPDFS
jgi:hypothetical protein